MSKNYLREHHGKKRSEKKTVAIGGTGTQTASVSLRDATLFSFTTDACTATALTIDVTDLQDGAEFRIHFNSLHCCDTLAITANGTADVTFSDGSTGRNTAITVADQNLLKGYVIDKTDGSEIMGISYEIF